MYLVLDFFLWLLSFIKIYFQNSLEYLKNIESEIKEKEKKIIIRRQKIDEENIKTKKLEEICVDKNKIILDAQIEIKKKQSQLEVPYIL